MKSLLKKTIAILFLLTLGFAIIGCGEKVDCRHCGGTGEPCTNVYLICSLELGQCPSSNNKCMLCLGLGYNRER